MDGGSGPGAAETTWEGWLRVREEEAAEGERYFVELSGNCLRWFAAPAATGPRVDARLEKESGGPSVVQEEVPISAVRSVTLGPVASAVETEAAAREVYGVCVVTEGSCYHFQAGKAPVAQAFAAALDQALQHKSQTSPAASFQGPVWSYDAPTAAWHARYAVLEGHELRLFASQSQSGPRDSPMIAAFVTGYPLDPVTTPPENTFGFSCGVRDNAALHISVASLAEKHAWCDAIAKAVDQQISPCHEEAKYSPEIVLPGDNGGVLVSGFLHQKRGSRWLRRWWEFRTDALHAFEGPGGAFLGAFGVANFSASPVAPPGAFGLELQSLQGKQYWLSAATDEDRGAWLRGVNGIGAEEAKASTVASPAGAASPVDSASWTPPEGAQAASSPGSLSSMRRLSTPPRTPRSSGVRLPQSSPTLEKPRIPLRPGDVPSHAGIVLMSQRTSLGPWQQLYLVLRGNVARCYDSEATYAARGLYQDRFVITDAGLHPSPVPHPRPGTVAFYLERAPSQRAVFLVSPAGRAPWIAAAFRGLETPLPKGLLAAAAEAEAKVHTPLLFRLFGFSAAANADSVTAESVVRQLPKPRMAGIVLRREGLWSRWTAGFMVLHPPMVRWFPSRQAWDERKRCSAGWIVTDAEVADVSGRAGMVIMVKGGKPLACATEEQGAWVHAIKEGLHLPPAEASTEAASSSDADSYCAPTSPWDLPRMRVLRPSVSTVLAAAAGDEGFEVDDDEGTLPSDASSGDSEWDEHLSKGEHRLFIAFGLLQPRDASSDRERCVNGLKLLAVLSMEDATCEPIHISGGPQLVAEAMERFPMSEAVQEKGLKVLANLACGLSCRAEEMVTSGILGSVFAAMSNHVRNAPVQAKGCWVLKNLSCCPENVAHIVQDLGGNAVMTALRTHPEDALVQEQGLGALNNLVALSGSHHAQDLLPLEAMGLSRVLASAKDRFGDLTRVQVHVNELATVAGMSIE